MEILERKYIDLLLDICLNFNQSKSLMIHCDFEEHVEFAKKIKEEANRRGILDVCINVNDLDKIHEYLKNTPTENIKLNPLIDRSKWEEYAQKGGALLFLSSTVPGLMNDIPSEKIHKWTIEREKTTPYYRKNVSKYIFPWCIAAVPNERWAKTIFGDSENAYEKLYLNIMKMCMVDRKNPVEEWNKYISDNNYFKNRLNELQIRKMYFKNSLGTDLIVEIPEGNTWLNLDKKDMTGNYTINNMPSYEIFNTPDYRKTNGIVYASRPLYYNDSIISDFSITFKDGKAIECKAEEGQKLLESLLFDNKNTCYLGEVALVPNSSPISQTGLVFNKTLFDENASCHLAVGRGFTKNFDNYENLSDEELIAKGLNITNIHVDFMFGTPDLDVLAETNEGEKLILKKGEFNL